MRIRWLALRTALVFVLSVLGASFWRLSDPSVTPPDDFIQYWAAGRLNVQGENPYDPALVLAIQRTANWQRDVPYRTPYPPYALPLVTPLVVLSYRTGRFLWYLLQIGVLLAAARDLWTRYGGDPRARALALVVLATFWPTIVDVRTGQISAFLLLGVVGFLRFADQGRWVAAGASLALVAVKPALLPVFWLAMLLWTVRERRWGVLVGGVGAVVALLALALESNPHVVGQFVHMALYDRPNLKVSSLGMAARVGWQAIAGRDAPWLQVLPVVAGVAWIVRRWWRRRERWSWHDEMPVVLLGAKVTTPYGWVYDDVLLLVPVMLVLVSLSRAARARPAWILAAYVLINVVTAAVNVVNVAAFWYFWVAPAWLLWWVAATRSLGAPLPATAASVRGR